MANRGTVPLLSNQESSRRLLGYTEDQQHIRYISHQEVFHIYREKIMLCNSKKTLFLSWRHFIYRQKISLGNMSNKYIQHEQRVCWNYQKKKIRGHVGPLHQSFEGPHNFSKAQIWTLDLKTSRFCKGLNQSRFLVNIYIYNHLSMQIMFRKKYDSLRVHALKGLSQ